jgi:hypothetical protein
MVACRLTLQPLPIDRAPTGCRSGRLDHCAWSPGTSQENTVTSPDRALVTHRTPAAPDGSLRPVYFLKLSPDAIFDPVWGSIAHRTGQAEERVFYVFVAMLSHAWKAEPRGSLAGFRPEDWIAKCRCDENDLAEIVAAMRGRLHDGERILNWAKWQPADPLGAQRQQRSEERAKDQARIAELEGVVAELGGGLTPPDAGSREREREIEDTTPREGDASNVVNLRVPQPGDVEGLLQLLLEAAGAAIDLAAPEIRDVSPILALMAEPIEGDGPAPCSLLDDILPAIRSRAPGLEARRVRSWRYFTVLIRQWNTNRQVDPLSTGIQQELGLERPGRNRGVPAGLSARAHSAVADGDVGARLVAARRAGPSQ